MPVQDTQSPIRGSAAWIARQASGLLNATPGLQPLDAVRLAMIEASGNSSPKPGRGLSKPGTHGARR
jgi:hypothetical protein